MAYFEVITGDARCALAGRLLTLLSGIDYEYSVSRTENGFMAEIENSDERFFSDCTAVFRLLNRLLGRTEAVCSYCDESPVVPYYDCVDVECRFDPDTMQVQLDFDADLACPILK